MEAELADAPWRGPMANASDFFNFGNTEGEFKDGETRWFYVGDPKREFGMSWIWLILTHIWCLEWA